MPLIALQAIADIGVAGPTSDVRFATQTHRDRREGRLPGVEKFSFGSVTHDNRYQHQLAV
jgi:hypothetical protein